MSDGIRHEAKEVPAGIRPDATYFPELESLRGIAIALVVAFHADATMLFPFGNRVGTWPSPPLAFLYGGHTGVTLFFVLSAFLLGLPFLEAAYGGRSASVAAFYRRRALRILPLYYCAVVAATVLTAHSVHDLWRGAPYLLFLESYPSLPTPLEPWSGVWWTLATEVQFYAVLPLVASTFGRSRTVTAGMLAIYGLGYLAVTLGFVVPGLDSWVRAHSIIGRGPIFLFGLLAAWLWLRHGHTLRARLAASRWWSAGGADLLLIVVLLALGLLLRWSAFHGSVAFEVSWRYLWHVPEGLLWTLVVVIVLLCPLRTKALLSNRGLARLGVLSYSIYVLHPPLFDYTLSLWRGVFPQAGLGWTLLNAVWLALATMLCVGLASLTYRWIERPFLVRKARVDDRVPAAPARAA